MELLEITGYRPVDSETSLSTLYRAYLPLNYNDGSIIERERIEAVLKELHEEWSGYTEHAVGSGWWTDPHNGLPKHDSVFAVEVLVPHCEISRLWFEKWRKRTEEVLDQSEIFLYSHQVRCSTGG
jgi:hypothetical protein